jgi:hypothetical protein
MEHNSLDDINSISRGGFAIPGALPSQRAPRQRIGTNTGLPPAVELPVKDVERNRQTNLRRQDVRTQAKTETQPKESKAKMSRSTRPTVKTSPKTKTSKPGNRPGVRTKVIMSAGKAWAGGYGGKPPGTEPEEGQPGESFPTGEVEYLGGPRVFTPDSKFDGISEIDSADQVQGSWAGDPSFIRTLYQKLNFQAYPNYGGILARKGTGDLSNASMSQDEIFTDKVAGVKQYYSEEYNANLAFENTFTETNFYLHQFDTNRLHAEYVCLLQRAAYFESKSDQHTENAAAAKIGNVLNTTDFYPIRNKCARALKRQYISKDMRDTHYEMLQTYRLTPHETGGTIFYVTDNMGEMLDDLSAATTSVAASTAITTYINILDTMCDYVLYGRPAQSTDMPVYMKPKRDFSGELRALYTTGQAAYSTSTRNSMNSILGRVSGRRGPFDFVKLNYQERGNSMSLYDPHFCDKFNNTASKNIDGSTTLFFPPLKNGGTGYSKAQLGSSPYYVSESSSDNQVCSTAFHMLLHFAGESPICYSNSRSSNNHTRRYLTYVGRRVNISNESRDLCYLSRACVIIPGNQDGVPIQDNFVTKMYFSNDTYYGFTAPDGDGAPLFFVTYGRVIDKFKQKYMVN